MGGRLALLPFLLVMLSVEVCKAKGMSVGLKENSLLSPALRFTSGFAVYSTWYRGLPSPCEEKESGFLCLPWELVLH